MVTDQSKKNAGNTQRFQRLERSRKHIRKEKWIVLDLQRDADAEKWSKGKTDPQFLTSVIKSTLL